MKSCTKWEGYNKGGGWKITKLLHYIKKPVVTIGKKNLDNFQGQSTGSTGWVNIDCEWIKGTFSTPEPEFYRICFEINIERQDIETYITFVVTLDNNKFTEKYTFKCVLIK